MFQLSGVHYTSKWVRADVRLSPGFVVEVHDTQAGSIANSIPQGFRVYYIPKPVPNY